MKKVITLILLLLIMSGSCVLRPDFNMEFTLDTYKADMSLYDGITSVGHNFKGTTVKELERTINEKGYGAFVLSRSGCDHCQFVMKYINEVAQELNVYIYYLDAESKVYPIVENEDYDLLDSILKPIEEELDGEICLQTPHFFTIIRGQFVDSFVGAGVDDTYSPSDTEIENLKNKFRNALKVFSKE